MSEQSIERTLGRIETKLENIEADIAEMKADVAQFRSWRDRIMGIVMAVAAGSSIIGGLLAVPVKKAVAAIIGGG